MHTDLLVAAGLGAALLASTAVAQTAVAPGSANALIQNRRDANATALQRRAEDEAQGIVGKPEDEKVAPTVSLGVAYENGGNGARLVSIPFVIDYAPGSWYLAAGGGATSARSDGGHDRGWNDLSISASYTLTSSSDPRWRLTPTLTVLVPAAGEVGSNHSVQIFDVSLGFAPLKGWELSVDASLAHDNASVDGVSRYSRGVSLKGKYTWPTKASVSLLIDRSLNSGNGGTTASVFEYDFPIRGRPALTGILILSRIWTEGQRSTGLEFDLNYAF